MRGDSQDGELPVLALSLGFFPGPSFLRESFPFGMISLS
jgi:hypothetical protein